ncbi:MAG: DNA repair protein Rad52 [Arcobacter sp.]|nr:MAG: DNA repair protein Rad52 [Arcobacter sp.]
MFNEKQKEVLDSELASKRIKTRQKGNINLSYIAGFDIIETANLIFGYGNWSYSISKLEKVSQETNQNQNIVICYKAIIEVVICDIQHSREVKREDVGFGTGIAKTLADAHESGAKEAVTDAIKRTLRSFGNQFGNSLYDKSRNHANNQQTPQIQNNNSQQKHIPNNQQQSFQQPYQNQQDFSQLTNLGLSVIQQDEYLIVVGDGVFENKEIIKQHGFRWDGTSKSWYIQLSQAS